MNIAIMMPSLGLSGGVRRMVGLSNELIKRGHDVTVYHTDGGPCRWLNLAASTKPLRDLPGSHFDVFMFIESTTDAKEIEGKVTADCKVFYVLGFEPEQVINPTSARSTVFGKFLHRSDLLILGCSSWMKGWLTEQMPEVRIEILLKGVDWNLFYPGNRPELVAPTFLRSGDTRKRKNHQVVIDALKLVRERYPAADFRSYHKKGFSQNQMGQVYKTCHVFVDGQAGYGFANAPFEAMACGTPVVCTDCFGVEDFAFHEKTALLVPVGDSRGLAEAAIMVYEDEALARKLARGGFNHLTQNFDWLETGERFQDLVKERTGTLEPRDKAAHQAFTIPGKTREIELKVLFDMAQKAPEGLIVDLGTYQGRSAAVMALAGRDVVTIDNFTEGPSAKNPEGTKPTVMRVQFNLSHFGVDKRVRICKGDTSTVPAAVNDKPVSLVFVDGAHVEDQLTKDILTWEPLIQVGGYLGFHDFGNPRWPDVEPTVKRLLNLKKWQDVGLTKWTKFYRRVA